MTYDIIYYVFAVVIVLSALVCAFSKNIMRSAFALFLTLIAVSALYVILHSELFALVNILFISGIAIMILIFIPKIKFLFSTEESQLNKTHFISVITISLLVAIISSIVASTRWQRFEINYDVNSYTLIFSKFMPLVILVAIIASVIIFLTKFILKKNNS